MRIILLFFKLILAEAFQFSFQRENLTDGEIFEYSIENDRELVTNVKLWAEFTKRGNIALPFSFEEWFPIDGKKAVRKILRDLESDLGCIEPVEVSRDDLRSTEFKHGIMFVWNRYSCQTTVGQTDFDLNLGHQGAKNTWQGEVKL